MSIDKSQNPIVHPASKSGNGIIYRVIREGEWWTVEFLSEPRTSPQSLWFHIEAEGIGGHPVRFVWLNADQALGSPQSLKNDKPVITVNHGDWIRCSNVRTADHLDGRKHLIFECDQPCDTISAAFCYPYTSVNLDKTLEEIGGPVPEIIGVTGQGRPMRRLCTSISQNKQSRGVYITARQHAGETPGSWVLDGMLRTLAAGDLGKDIHWWIVPFVDLDGVENGDYGKDAHPWDFNRAWEIMPMRPEVLSIQADLRRFAARYPSRLLIDLHAPGHGEEGMWMFMPRAHRPTEQRKTAERMATLLAEVVPELNEKALMRETNYASRWGMDSTINSWAWDHLDRTPGISLETSYQRLPGRILDIEGYRDLGRELVAAISRWFDTQTESDKE